MRRLFYRGILQETITITGDDAHHLTHVLRKKPGDVLTVVDDCGTVANMVIESFAGGVTLRLSEILPPETSEINVTLAQCLLKGDKMELVVQKATELGAMRIVPIASKNVVVRYDEKKAAAKVSRWQKIGEEAAKQCGRRDITAIEGVLSLEDFLNARKREPLVFCYENEGDNSLKGVLKDIDEKNFTLLVGPEGGFTLDEAAAIKKAGGKSVSLGKRILRAETAALAVLAIAMYEKE